MLFPLQHLNTPLTCKSTSYFQCTKKQLRKSVALKQCGPSNAYANLFQQTQLKYIHFSSLLQFPSLTRANINQHFFCVQSIHMLTIAPNGCNQSDISYVNQLHQACQHQNSEMNRLDFNIFNYQFYNRLCFPLRQIQFVNCILFVDVQSSCRII